MRVLVVVQGRLGDDEGRVKVLQRMEEREWG